MRKVLHFADERGGVKKLAQGPKIRGGGARIQTGSRNPDSLALSQLSHHSAKYLPDTSSCLFHLLLSHENSWKGCHQFSRVCLLRV